MEYKEYLKRENYTATTIKSYELQAHKFIEWSTKQGLKLNVFQYKNAISYVAYLQKRHSNIKTINSKLNATRHYFEYLLKTEEVTVNPFIKIKVQGEKKNKVLRNLLSSDELEDLYYSYDTETDKHPRRKLIHKRNKVLVGLLVYQGITTTDLKKLELEHLELYKGKIYIPKGKIGNRRTLELKPWQVMEFMIYIKEVRPKLLPKNKPEITTVFYASKLADSIAVIIKKLKKINNKVENVHQLRASVIVLWLGKYNLREVQILAGHKYISSTEKYIQEDLKQLQEVINNYHPLS